MTAPEPLLRGVSSPPAPELPATPAAPTPKLPEPLPPPLPPDKSILLVKTSLESLRSVWVRLRDASASVRVSETAKLAAALPASSISMEELLLDPAPLSCGLSTDEAAAAAAAAAAL